MVCNLERIPLAPEILMHGEDTAAMGIKTGPLIYLVRAENWVLILIMPMLERVACIIIMVSRSA